MIRLLLLVLLLSSGADWSAHADWCSGIITSNGTCIGSQGDTNLPVTYCDYYGRCYRRDGGSNLEKFAA